MLIENPFEKFSLIYPLLPVAIVTFQIKKIFTLTIFCWNCKREKKLLDMKIVYAVVTICKYNFRWIKKNNNNEVFPKRPLYTLTYTKRHFVTISLFFSRWLFSICFCSTLITWRTHEKQKQHLQSGIIWVNTFYMCWAFGWFGDAGLLYIHI